MGTIFSNFLVVTGVVAVLASPLWIVAWRRNRIDSARNFLFGALGIGLICGFIAGASERQVQQCLDAGNSDCVDSGGAGLQLVIIALYLIVVWIVAYLMWREG